MGTSAWEVLCSMDTPALKNICTQVRRDIINMTANAGSGHPGGSLSAVEMLVALYFDVMNVDPKNPSDPARDRLVLSKGHAAPALYGVLGEKGYFSTEEFKNFRQLHSILQGHPDAKKCPGVDASTGSLGQGISIAVGMALGAKTTGNPCHVYAICGDGELQEGLVWEASMAAAHYGLDNLTVLVDNNGLQIDGNVADVMSPYPIDEKFKAFGFHVINIDGHDFDQIEAAYQEARTVKGQPTAIIAKTVKGKGVSFMENQASWHGTAPNDEQYEVAMKELGEQLKELEC